MLPNYTQDCIQTKVIISYLLDTRYMEFIWICRNRYNENELHDITILIPISFTCAILTCSLRCTYNHDGLSN